MQSFTILYSVLGGLGIFFYGMKLMSDSLQASAGETIKMVINSLTKNRVLAVLVGLLVTTLVQSSSVTTVMVVGFVNAGLMSLTQSIGVILGANIGTTITGWIISIKIGKYGLLLIGAGIFPMLFGKTTKSKNIGQVLFGIGMIFFGLQIMSGAFKPLRSMPEFLEAISYFSGSHYGAYIASALVGCLLTMVIQSSSAMLGITIAMASSGVISFQTAAALVLGENIGTTITALLASVGGNINAKRAAKAHAIFNCLGVVLILCFFPLFVEFVEWLIPGQADFVNASGDKPNIAVHIATGHTMFNVTATLVFLPFLNYLAKIVTKIHPDAVVKEKHHLKILGNPSDMIPATALVQAETENKKLKDIIDRMFEKTIEYLEADKNDARTLAKIKDYERITDNIEKEVTLFICKLMESPLTPSQSTRAQAIVRIADELESVADYLDKLATYKTRFTSNSKLDGSAREEFLTFLQEVKSYYDGCCSGVIAERTLDVERMNKLSIELKLKAEQIRENHLERIAKKDYNPLTALTYSDMVVALRKIRSHSHNIVEALSRTVHGDEK
jgi:phosphate:Na+ symporter